MTDYPAPSNARHPAAAAAGSPWREISRRALDVLLPPQCLNCGTVVARSGVLCATCWDEAVFIGPPACSVCGLPFEFEAGGEGGVLCGACLAQRPPFARARAAMVYGKVSRSLILAFKHGDRTESAPTLADWLMRAGAELVAEADFIAPVPLHWTRLWARRFNQSAMLAGHIARRSGTVFAADLLVRTRRTPPQTRMGPAARRRNTRGAFRLKASWRGRIEGRRVLLIDDVLTTGATVSNCARALLRGGAAAVDVLTVARAVRAAAAER